MSLIDRYTDLECDIKEKIAANIKLHGVEIPNYSKLGLSTKGAEEILSHPCNHLITHVTEDTCYDEDGLSFATDYIIENNIHAVCEWLDTFE